MIGEFSNVKIPQIQPGKPKRREPRQSNCFLCDLKIENKPEQFKKGYKLSKNGVKVYVIKTI